MTGRLFYSEFMGDMVRILPANIWFQSMTTQMQDPAHMTVKLNAQSLDNYAIADLVAALSIGTNFSGPELGPISTNTPNAGKPVVSAFTISFNYRKEQK
jgi:Tfp pilus assembly protein PilN